MKKILRLRKENKTKEIIKDNLKVIEINYNRERERERERG